MRHCCTVIVLLFSIVAVAACGGNAVTPPVGSGSSASARSADAVQRNASGYRQLYVFKGTPDGASPLAGLAVVGSTLYGTTLNGSKNYCAQSCGSNECYLGCGTIFSIDAHGNENVVYNFEGNFNSAGDGSWPFAGVMQAASGTVYGTTSGAGKNGEGTVWEYSGSQEKVLYSFAGGQDASIPEAPLIEWKGKLYGTTVYGGGSGCGGSGCGTAFEITKKGAEKVLYRFQGGNDGARVYAGLTLFKNALYGATLEGGSGCGSSGCGTIFKLSRTGKETVLYRFGGTTDGAFPNGLTAGEHGMLYGTTEGGGSRSSGTFFSVTTSGQLTTLYNFQDIPDGNLPGADLILYRHRFYGTTVGGGTTGNGSVFSLTPTGSEKVLYSFQSGSDGAAAQAPLIEYKKKLYSTTYHGGGTGCGGNGCGTVFSVSP